jgi:luciferase family oxidoreductase group 1
MIPVSVLDLVPVRQGETPVQALPRALDLCQHVEGWGYRRYWVAEHHNMVGIASSATSVVIGYLAGGTRTIRVGSGGIMLPNHAPLVIAEQFGTLASLHPGRIDLGLGRAPGTDQLTMRALRVHPGAAEHFTDDIQTLQYLFDDAQPEQAIRAVPGTGTHVPLWILGSSTYGAQVAAHFGLPYGFASHFAPADLDAALRVYRARFQPSAQLERSWAMPCVSVLVADTDQEARYLFSSHQQRVTDMVRNRRGLLAPPIDDIDTYWTPAEKMHASRMLECAFVGSPDTVRTLLQRFLERTGADELMVSCTVFEHAARLRSYELLAGIAQELEPVHQQAAALA